jgi:hypothetical protein
MRAAEDSLAHEAGEKLRQEWELEYRRQLFAHAAARVEAGATQGQIAQKIGRTQSYVAHKLRLLKLPDTVQHDLAAGRLTEGHARQLLRLDGPERQLAAATVALFDGMSVQALREYIDRGCRRTADETERAALRCAGTQNKLRDALLTQRRYLLWALDVSRYAPDADQASALSLLQRVLSAMGMDAAIARDFITTTGDYGSLPHPALQHMRKHGTVEHHRGELPPARAGAETAILALLDALERQALAALEADLTKNLDALQTATKGIADSVRSVAGTLTAPQLTAWALAEHNLRPAELAALLAYEDGAIPDIVIEWMARRAVGGEALRQIDMIDQGPNAVLSLANLLRQMQAWTGFDGWLRYEFRSTREELAPILAYYGGPVPPDALALCARHMATRGAYPWAKEILS